MSTRTKSKPAKGRSISIWQARDRVFRADEKDWRYLVATYPADVQQAITILKDSSTRAPRTDYGSPWSALVLEVGHIARHPTRTLEDLLKHGKLVLGQLAKFPGFQASRDGYYRRIQLDAAHTYNALVDLVVALEAVFPATVAAP